MFIVKKKKFYCILIKQLIDVIKPINECSDKIKLALTIQTREIYSIFRILISDERSRVEWNLHLKRSFHWMRVCTFEVKMSLNRSLMYKSRFHCVHIWTQSRAFGSWKF